MNDKKCVDCGKPSKYDRCFDCFEKFKAASEKKEFKAGEWTPTDSMADNLYAIRVLLGELVKKETGKVLKKNEETKYYEMVADDSI